MEPFLGQLQLFAFNFVPSGWLRCEGQLLPISQYQALFALLGTRYGGNGTTTFALPDMRGRACLGAGQAPGGTLYELAQHGGAEGVTLTPAQIPSHTHVFGATDTAPNSKAPANALLTDLGAQGASMYAPAIGAPPATMAATACMTAGGSWSHSNMQPYIAMTWAIAIQGVWPSRP